MKKYFRIITLLCTLLVVNMSFAARVKDIARLEGAEENHLVGYGLVIGLAGSGDSSRTHETIQSISNILTNFNVTLNPTDINSRNVAAVMITAQLPSFAHEGDKIDVTVSSIGDARSLVGGTLLVAPLKGADNQVYLLAQGPVSVGGFKYDMYGNLLQKNHPTVGIVPNGGIIEKTLHSTLVSAHQVRLILNQSDFTSSARLETAINEFFKSDKAHAVEAGIVAVDVSDEDNAHLIHFLSALEDVAVEPDSVARVVVNERTGTVVAGGDVELDAVTISQGSLRVSIATEYNVSQPNGGIYLGDGPHTQVVPNTDITTEEPKAALVTLKKGACVADLVQAMSRVGASTRDIIAVLQGVKSAGALHAELVIE